MQKEILIFAACKQEASTFLNKSKYKFIKKNEYFVHSDDKFIIKVLITGIGKTNVQSKLDKIKSGINPDLIIKAGTCAVLDDNLPLFTAYIPSFVYYSDKIINLDFNLLNEDFKNKVTKYISKFGLITIDSPLKNFDTAEEFKKDNFYFADMETFFILDKFKNCPFIPLLIGTDRGDSNAVTDFFKNVEKAGEVISATIIDIIG